MKLGFRPERTYWLAVVAALCVGFGSSSAIGQSSLPNIVFAGGGGTISAGQFRVHSTIGEPVAGTISNGSLRLVSGFQATFVGLGDPAPVDGRIFYDGFEDD